MKTIWSVVILLIVFVMFSADEVVAGQGCCSWHGGQAYCDDEVGRWVCNDGTYSPSCGCERKRTKRVAALTLEKKLEKKCGNNEQCLSKEFRPILHEMSEFYTWISVGVRYGDRALALYGDWFVYGEENGPEYILPYSGNMDKSKCKRRVNKALCEALLPGIRFARHNNSIRYEMKGMGPGFNMSIDNEPSFFIIDMHGTPSREFINALKAGIDLDIEQRYSFVSVSLMGFTKALKHLETGEYQ